MILSTKQKQTYRHGEQTCGCQGGGGKKWDEWGVWGWQMRAITIRMISNEVLLYRIGNYIKSLGIDHNGRQYQKKNMYMCVYIYMYMYIYALTGSLCFTVEIDSTL